MPAPLPPVPQLTKLGFADPVWARWLNLLRANIVANVTALVIQTANGFGGTVTVDSSGQATVTLDTTVSGILKGLGGAIVAATPGVDYLADITATLPLSISGGAVPDVSMTQAGGAANGWLSSTDWNTFNNKLSGNQTITLSGDVSGTGTTAITTTLASTGVTAGSYGSGSLVPMITVDAKGRLTAVSTTAVTGAPPGYGPTTGRPATPANGTMYFDTTVGFPVWYSAGSWYNAAGVVS